MIIVDRDFLQEPLTGVEFAVYLSMADLGTIYRDRIILTDVGIYFNMADEMPTKRQRGEINEAINSLIEGGYVVAEEIQTNTYLVNCQKSFRYDLKHLPHGGSPIVYDRIKAIIKCDKSWRNMLRYYLLVLGHMGQSKKCVFSRQYFAEKLGISELTLSKYNTKFKELGVLKIIRQTDMPNIYLTT